MVRVSWVVAGGVTPEGGLTALHVLGDNPRSIQNVVNAGYDHDS